MSSYEKVVKLACKPKAAPPKAKYLDPIISATYSEEGAVHDVCRALVPRFREPNAIVVFKALIVLHTMIRNGDANNLLSYLTSSTSDVLRLRNVTTTQWDGYRTPENMSNYAIYLDARIRAYKDLKHDVIRVQAESNRDMRAASISSPEEAKSRTSTPHRSKTIMGRKLRVMTVEKGLLRETKVVQKMIDALISCRFYLDDLEDELTLTALAMLVKDLLVLFQAGNEGVINVLEHYFEMSKIDAEQALALYRSFCKQTESVVEYLGVAKKLQNLLNVNIPNLRHAPVSLAGALEEYLEDPNFEQNRIEYKTQKSLADAQGKSGGILKKDKGSKPSTPQPAKVPTPKPEAQPVASTSTAAPAKPENQAMLDFFSSIEQEQTPMFNPQTGSPTANYFQQQSAFNPFVQRQMAMATGMPQQPFVQVQATGMVSQTNPFGPPPFQQPQMTGFGMPQPSPFNPMQQPSQQPQGLFPSQLAPPQQQATGMLQQPQPTGFLRPQATGSNPFRQSMLMPQGTGFSPFGSPNGAAGQPFLTTGNAALRPAQTQSAQGMSAPPSAPPTTAPFGAMNNFPGSSPFAAALIARPASTPIVSNSGPTLNRVATHQTGSKNPFGQPKYDPPPVPKPPSMAELAGVFGAAGSSQAGTNTGNNPFGTLPTAQPQNKSPNNGQSFGLMANIASSFTGQPQSATAALNKAAFTFPELDPQPTSTSTAFSDFSSLSFGSTPSSATAPSISINNAFDIPTANALQPQATGFGGIKPFKPSSSFGAELMEKNPVKPQPTGLGALNSQPTGFGTGLNAQPTGFGTGLSAFGGGNSTPFSSSLGAIPEALTGNAATSPANQFGGMGSTVGVGLRPQATGATGASNPFRASMMGLGSGSPSPFGGLNTNPTGFAGMSSSPTGINSLTSSATGSPFGSAANSPFAGLPPPFSSTLGQNGTAPTASTSPFSTNHSFGTPTQNGTAAFPGASAFGLGTQNGTTSPFPGAGGAPSFGANLFGASAAGGGQNAQKQQQGQMQTQFGSLI